MSIGFCFLRKQQKKNNKKAKEKDGDEEHSDSESDESRNDSKTEKVAFCCVTLRSKHKNWLKADGFSMCL